MPEGSIFASSSDWAHVSDRLQLTSCTRCCLRAYRVAAVHILIYQQLVSRAAGGAVEVARHKHGDIRTAEQGSR